MCSCTTKTEPIALPIMGWSSWNAFMTEISDSIIIHQADVMASSGLSEVGYEYVNIDDGYFGGRDENGTLLVHPVRFPSGIEWVVDHIHGLGLKAGIYSDAGDNTCGSLNNKDSLGIGAGLYGHDAQDIDQFFNKWKFDFFKVDFCGGRQLNLDAQERYRTISNTIKEISTRPVVFNVCRWRYPGTWVSEVSDSWRISGDLHPSWNRVNYVVKKNMYLSAYAGGGHYNDMDMLVVGYNGKPTGLWMGTVLTYEEEEAHFGMWCIMSSPLLLGCDMEFIPERTKEIITNRELIALNQDPLGLQAYVVQHDGKGYVFVKDILARGGNTRAVALYNPCDSTIDFSVPSHVLSFDGVMKLRDLNRHEDLEDTDCIRMSVPGHGAKILRAEGRRIEQTIYEAEWGFIPTYNEISEEGGKYAQCEAASCGAYVIGLGGSDECRLEWREVVSSKAGKKHILLTLFPTESGEAVLSVGKTDYPFSFDAAEDGKAVTVTIKAKLAKGVNTVIVRSQHALPPIDYLEIK